jgi:hypothetical protein
MNEPTLILKELTHIDLRDYNVYWTSQKDEFLQPGLALKSDIGDLLISIWKSSKGYWRVCSTQCGTQSEATAEALKYLSREIASKISRLATFLHRSNHKGCLTLREGYFPLKSIERAITEDALHRLLNTPQPKICRFLAKESRSNYPMLYEIKKVSLPYRFKDGLCMIKPLPITIDVDFYHVDGTFSHWQRMALNSLYDDAIDKFKNNLLLNQLRQNVALMELGQTVQ